MFCRPHLVHTGKLEISGGPTDAVVALPEDELVSVPSNLVINSSHAVKAGEGKILLHVEQQDRAMVFRVTENGSGISPEHLSQVFDMFFTTKAPGKGSALVAR